MGNANSSENRESYPQAIESDLPPEYSSPPSRPRLTNRLSKPKVGAPTQTPIAAALTRTLSSKQLNELANTSKPLPNPPRRTGSIDALRRSRSNSQCQWYDKDGNVYDAPDTPTYSNSLLDGANSEIYLRDFEAHPHAGDVGEPPLTSSSTESSSYHSASQSPIPPDPYIPVRRRSLLNAAAPGTATRPRSVAPEVALAPEPEPEQEPLYNESLIAKLAALDLSHSHRCETPKELELLGSLKKGSLFVTNGAPSPAPSSPELRSTSIGSIQSRTMSLPSLSHMPTIDPKRPSIEETLNHGRPNIRVDTDGKQTGGGLRIVPPSPEDDQPVTAIDSQKYAPQHAPQQQTPEPSTPRTPLEKSRPISQFSFEQSVVDEAPAQGLKRQSSVIVVGTVAETIPDRSDKSMDVSGTPIQPEERPAFQRLPTSQSGDGTFETPPRTGTDSGYSSNTSFFTRKSWRKSMGSIPWPLSEPTKKHKRQATQVDTFDFTPNTPPQFDSPTSQSRETTPIIVKKKSGRSAGNTPNATPTKGSSVTSTPTKKTPTKRFLRGRLSFRRKSEVKEMEHQEAPSTESFQVMQGTLPFEGRSFDNGSVYALDFDRKSLNDPHRTAPIPTPPEPIYRDSKYYEKEEEPVFEALTCDSPVTYTGPSYYQQFSNPIPTRPNTVSVDKIENLSQSSSEDSLPLITNYDESELPPIPYLPPPPAPEPATPSGSLRRTPSLRSLRQTPPPMRAMTPITPSRTPQEVHRSSTPRRSDPRHRMASPVPPMPSTTPPARNSQHTYSLTSERRNSQKRGPPPSAYRPVAPAYEPARPRSAEGDRGDVVDNSAKKPHKRRSLGAGVLRPRNSGDMERWGVDVPVLKAEDLVNGYGSLRQRGVVGVVGGGGGSSNYDMETGLQIDASDMFARSNGGDYDDDDDSEDEFAWREKKKKEKRTSFWRRRSKSRPRSTIEA